MEQQYNFKWRGFQKNSKNYIFPLTKCSTDFPILKTPLLVPHNILSPSLLPVDIHTWAIKHCKEDGGDPSSVTVAHSKLPDELFEEDADCFGKCVGETSYDEAAEEDSPAPSSIRCLDPAVTSVDNRSTHDAQYRSGLSCNKKCMDGV